jgi:hypothetical protein
MTAFNKEQALAHFIELHEKRHQEIDQRPDLQRRMARGDYDFTVNVDYELRDLEQEAQRNGFVLEWNWDRQDFILQTQNLSIDIRSPGIPLTLLDPTLLGSLQLFHKVSHTPL